MVNLNHVRHFFYCAQFGSVSSAAERLGIAQPSLSSQLKTFEEEIGFRLFIRTGRGLQLTPRGEALFKKTSHLFEVVQDIENFIANEEDLDSVSFRVGVTDEIERPFLADVIGQLMKSQSSKKISATIISKAHAEIVDLALGDRLDIIISDRKITGLNLVDEYKIPVMLVSSKNYLGTKVQQMSNVGNLLKSLEQDLVLPADDLLLGAETKKYLKEMEIKMHVAIRSNILACMVRSVQEHVGASFLPTLYVNKEIKNGTLYAYGPQNGFWKHRIFLYTKSQKKKELILLFSNIIRKLTL
jgi:LysR family transcriptional activator of nhaA